MIYLFIVASAIILFIIILFVRIKLEISLSNSTFQNNSHILGSFHSWAEHPRDVNLLKTALFWAIVSGRIIATISHTTVEREGGRIIATISHTTVEREGGRIIATISHTTVEREGGRIIATISHTAVDIGGGVERGCIIIMLSSTSRVLMDAPVIVCERNPRTWRVLRTTYEISESSP